MCGFISILAPKGQDVLKDVLDGLLAIQHRGQDAAGVVTFDGTKFNAKKGLGLVSDVFSAKHASRLKGHIGVGHVRYPTVGKGEGTDVQPFWLDFPFGLAMAHNGNVTNFTELKDDYFRRRNVFLTSDCDLEAVLLVMANKLMQRAGEGLFEAEEVFQAIQEVFSKVRGAYSVVGFLAGHGVFAFRDPYGIKPIILGTRKDEHGTSYAIASESVVLELTGYDKVRDLEAGEAIWIDNDYKITSAKLTETPHRPCIFEHVYFARPDSMLDDISVYKTRLRMGHALAHQWQKTGLRADVVIPVPESARTAAQAMAQELGLPFREGLVKSRYIGRTFIMPDDAQRRESVRQKLNPIDLEFRGKKVLLVDDSIVRGNTSKELIRMAREAGAKEVYLASYSPPLLHACPYGIDMATKRDFIARGKSHDELTRAIGCDYLLYAELAEMQDAARQGNPKVERFCTACFDGHYPTGDITEDVLESLECERMTAQN
ncbi:MAG: amidophosphoribosyltransferase [Planctomycetota bacterium]|nr:MAG: amidophosphoribosyltransferase [Planctomycetota bacterium]